MEIKNTLLAATPAAGTVQPKAALQKQAGDGDYETQAIFAAAAKPVREDKSERSVSEEAIAKAIEKANKAIQGVDKRFQYEVHEKTGDIIVKVLDRETNEIIREIPPEKILDLVAKLQEICGVIIDEKR